MSNRNGSSAIKANPLRRRMLRAGLAASSIFLPQPHAWVWAQSSGTLKLIRLPKIALVIGNSKYSMAPLKNPANDAKAIGEALAQSGFEVTTKLDASLTEMSNAVRTYTQELAKRKCVGVFYFAGHGMQLAWRNYILPVDANIGNIADIQKQSVEIGTLMDGLGKAANPLNVVILDACRDNPFGSLKGIDQKGLSQMDAPLSTFLAYATSPGNIASDGTGANGLYTESLLREIKVADAKVEDVFKRVRLAVRLKSNGRQIPWESTSLEDDFYFIPPKEIKKASDAEVERLYNEELAIWEKIKTASEPAPLENYLRQYPSGRFAELAQFQLDRVLARQGEKKIEIVNSERNPYTQGTARTNTLYRVGDSFSFRGHDLFTKLETRKYTERVTKITDSEVIYGDGNYVADLLGNPILSNGQRLFGVQYFPSNYYIGKKWRTRYKIVNANGEGQSEVELKVVAREQITVPAGTFNAFRIDAYGWWRATDGRQASTQIEFHRWAVPEIRRWIALVERLTSNGRVSLWERRELTAYSQQT